MRSFKITTEDTGKRLDVFLANALKNEYSRSQIQQAIRQGLSLVNKKPSKPGYKLRINDEIEFNEPLPKIIKTEPEDIPVDIIYEDDDIAVINKPCGMVVHPAAGNFTGTLVNAMLFHTKGNLSNLGSPLRPGVVHRLDKDVSGIMVLAKTDASYRELVKQFKSRSVIKKYVALVKGNIKLLEGKIEVPIGRSSRDRKKMAVSTAGKNAKSAITRYKVLKQFKDFAKILIDIETGRTHQIRVHMPHIGYPILGDTRYGGPTALPTGRQVQRLMLHALSLEFKHPATGKDLYFEAPLPREFA